MLALIMAKSCLDWFSLALGPASPLNKLHFGNHGAQGMRPSVELSARVYLTFFSWLTLRLERVADDEVLK
jgi:hypothetical protein